MNAALLAAQAYALTLSAAEKPSAAPVQVEIVLDSEVIGRAVAPVVSKVMGENLRREKFIPY